MVSEGGGPLRRLANHAGTLLIARLIVGGMFIVLGWNKLGDLPAFLKAIREYDIVPDGTPLLLNAIGALLPWMEIVCGLLLVLGVAVRGTSLLLLIMLVFFTGAIARRAVEIKDADGIGFCDVAFDCGCGTGVVEVCHKLPENIGLILLCVLILASQSRRLCLRYGLFGG